MNKQELEKQAEALYTDVRSFLDNTFELIDQIDEPQKVVVPEFIDSYIRYAKSEGMSLFIAMDNAQNKESEWIITNEETFARAWLFGYEIEQEKLYTVEIPDPYGLYEHRYLFKHSKGVTIGANDGTPWETRSECQLTESEIRKDFEWAWKLAKPVEGD